MEWVEFYKKLSSLRDCVWAPWELMLRDEVFLCMTFADLCLAPHALLTQNSTNGAERVKFIQPYLACVDTRSKLVLSHLEPGLCFAERQNDGSMSKRKLSDYKFREVDHDDGRSS